jgi:hypothetical protein
MSSTAPMAAPADSCRHTEAARSPCCFQVATSRAKKPLARSSPADAHHVCCSGRGRCLCMCSIGATTAQCGAAGGDGVTALTSDVLSSALTRPTCMQATARRMAKSQCDHLQRNAGKAKAGCVARGGCAGRGITMQVGPRRHHESGAKASPCKSCKWPEVVVRAEVSPCQWHCGERMAGAAAASNTAKTFVDICKSSDSTTAMTSKQNSPEHGSLQGRPQPC